MLDYGCRHQKPGRLYNSRMTLELKRPIHSFHLKIHFLSRGFFLSELTYFITLMDKNTIQLYKSLDAFIFNIEE